MKTVRSVLWILLLWTIPLTLNAQFAFITNSDGLTLTITGYTGPGGSVIIPATLSGNPVTSISADAFDNQSNLISVTILGNITNIGTAAFSNCPSLTSIYFASNAPAVAPSAFTGDSATVYRASASTGWTGQFDGLPVLAMTTQSLFTYQTNGNAITIVDYFGSGNQVVLPAVINGMPVTSITNVAFLGHTISSIVFPPTLTSIEGGFMLCTNLTSLSIPITCTNIANGAFQFCFNLVSVTMPPIPNFQYAFQGCPSLRTLTIADGVTFIPASSFMMAPALTTVTFPNSVTEIAGGAFTYCASLISVNFDSAVTNIGPGAFMECPNLTSLYFYGNAPSSSTYFSSASSNGPPTIYYYPGTAGWSNSLNYVITAPFPYSIATNAGTVGITGYTGPGGNLAPPAIIAGLPLASIATNAFYGATNVTGIFIPNGVTTIGSNAFAFCTNLYNVTIPASVTSIGDQAFLGCSNLAGIYYMSNAPVADSTVFTGDLHATNYYLFTSSGWTSPFAGIPSTRELPQNFFTYVTNAGAITLTGYTLSENQPVIFPFAINGLPVTSIGSNGMFSFPLSDKIPSLTIPGTVTNVEGTGNSDITNIIIMYGVQRLGTYACSGILMTNISIPSSVTTIGSLAFYDCINLTNLTIPLTVTNIGAYAFEDCASLTKVTIPGSITNFANQFQSCPKLANVIIENGTTNIAIGSFSDSLLTSLTIPPSVTSAGDGAFAGESITSITIPSISQIPMRAFQGCSDLTNVTTSNGVVTIDYDAFYMCVRLATVFISETLTNIEPGAFLDCPALVSFTVDTNNPVYSSLLGVLFDKNLNTLIECPQGLAGSYTVPATLTNIAPSAFAECTKLNAIYFTGNAPSVDATAFVGDSATAYYLPGTAGWSEFATNSGIPTVEWNPQIETPTLQSNQFTFNVIAPTNLTVVITASTDLTTWIPLQTNILSNGISSFNETVQTNTPGHYYRLTFP